MTNEERAKNYSRWSKKDLIEYLLETEDLTIKARADRDRYYDEGLKVETALRDAKGALDELEKVQVEIVARLEQAYLAVVKATLR